MNIFRMVCVDNSTQVSSRRFRHSLSLRANLAPYEIPEKAKGKSIRGDGQKCSVEMSTRVLTIVLSMEIHENENILFLTRGRQINLGRVKGCPKGWDGPDEFVVEISQNLVLLNI